MLYVKANAYGEQQFGTGFLFPTELVTDDRTVLLQDSGMFFKTATDAKTFQLPLITAVNIGMRFGFQNIGADGAVALTISPASADGIVGTVANAAADSVASGVVNKNIVNTKATANIGDYIWLEAVAVGKWAIIGGVGIWASEA